MLTVFAIRILSTFQLECFSVLVYTVYCTHTSHLLVRLKIRNLLLPTFYQSANRTSYLDKLLFIVFKNNPIYINKNISLQNGLIHKEANLHGDFSNLLGIPISLLLLGISRRNIHHCPHSHNSACCRYRSPHQDKFLPSPFWDTGSHLHICWRIPIPFLHQHNKTLNSQGPLHACNIRHSWWKPLWKDKVPSQSGLDIYTQSSRHIDPGSGMAASQGTLCRMAPSEKEMEMLAGRSLCPGNQSNVWLIRNILDRMTSHPHSPTKICHWQSWALRLVAAKVKDASSCESKILDKILLLL